MNKLSELVDRKFVESFDVSDYEILTDSGWSDISSVHKTVEYQVWKVVTQSGLELLCADTHIVFLDGFVEVFVCDLIPKVDYIITKNGLDLVVSVENLGYSEHMYDITVNDNNHRFYSNDILSHNTQTTVAYMLWLTIFNSDYTIAILANKEKLAIEILDRYQKSFELLPLWLKPGIKSFNKMAIDLENNSRLFASATSSSGIRGFSCNMIYLDEFAIIPNSLQESFYTSVMPVVSSGSSTKITISSTPMGLNLFYKLWNDSLAGRSGFNPIRVYWYDHPKHDENWKYEQIKLFGGSVKKFEQEYSCCFEDTKLFIESENKTKLITIGELFNLLDQ